MRILFVAPYLPTPLRLRPFELIRRLADRHRISVVALVHPGGALRSLNELMPFCEAVHPIPLDRHSAIARSLAALPTPQPLSVAYFNTPALRRAVETMAASGSFDLVHAEFLRAAPAVSGIDGIPRVFDAVDSLTLAYARAYQNRRAPFRRRLLAWEEWLKLRRYEPAQLRTFDAVLASSPVDAQALHTASGRAVETVPNGIDTRYFTGSPGGRNPDELLFVGGMNYYPNIDAMVSFCRHCLPSLKAARPRLNLTIVGVDPAPAVRRLGRLPGVTVTGGVPDLRLYLQRASVFVAPLWSGSGLPNKVLQAMACRAPVVTTPYVAAALGANHGEHLLVAKDEREFVGFVLQVLGDLSQARRLSSDAHAFVKQHFQWEKSVGKIEEVYRQLAGGS